MPNYRRWYQPGGTVWLTLVTEGRATFLCDPQARAALRAALRACWSRWPVNIAAIVLLPDHLHMIWTLPLGDVDYSRRLAFMKKEFTKAWLACGGMGRPVTASRRRNRRQGVWQRRFWEHMVRSPDEMDGLVDYAHFNPVHHGLVRCPHEWPYSSFHRYVREGILPLGWECACHGATVSGRFLRLAPVAGE